MSKNTIFKRILVLLTVTLFIITLFTACNNKKDAIVGSWKLDSISGTSLEDLSKASGISLDTLNTSYTFKENGRAIQSTSEKETDCTWKKNKDVYTLMIGSTDGTITLDGKIMTMSISGIDSTFIKQ